MSSAAEERAFGFSPVDASTGEQVELALQRLWLTGRVTAAGAKLTVEHVFASAQERPVEVVYCFALPRDAALRRFRIEGEGFTVESSLRETEEAVREYESAIERGALASLARQYPDGLINLTVGNLKKGDLVTVRLEVLAGVESRDDGFRFRFPFTLGPRYHAGARAAFLPDGSGEIELPRDEFGDLLLPPIRKDATGLHAVGFDLEVALKNGIAEVASPSHAVRVRNEDAGAARISLASEKDVPNRDLVLDARTIEPAPEVIGGRDSQGLGHFIAVIPSTSFGKAAKGPRNVVFVVDRSGSMSGTPMTQARKAVEACLGALAAEDRFGIVAFDNEVEVFPGGLGEASRARREKAREFLSTVDARGGTDLAGGFEAGAKLLAGKGGDLMVLTDGQVAGTASILARARATAIRIHMLGIGSSTEDRFLSQLAKETQGVSRFVTPRERVDLAAIELFSSIGRPVASAIRAEGADIVPAPREFALAGSPWIAYGTAAPEQTALRIAWNGGGPLEVPLVLEPSPLAETARLLRGARIITDFESRYDAGAGAAEGAAARESQRVSARLKAASREYGLVSREMSLVAVVTRDSDKAHDVPKTLVVPVGMPQDTLFDAYFNTGAAPTGQFMAMAALPPPPMSAPSPAAPGEGGFARTLLARVTGSGPRKRRPAEAAEPPARLSGIDLLLDLAARIEPDGGLPGRNLDARVDATIEALREFLDQGHTLREGAFRAHVERLVEFLRGAVAGLDASRSAQVEELLARATVGSV